MNEGELRADSESSRISRRRFVKTLGASGIGLASASNLSGRELPAVADGDVSITYAYARGDPDDPSSISPRTKTVSADWYNDLRAALSSYNTIDLGGIEGVLNAAVVPGDEAERSSISIGVTSESIVSQVQELLDETPIEGSIIEEAAGSDGPDLEPARQFDLESGFSVPGGVACGETEGIATLTPGLHDPETETTFFATADHLYADTESTELTLVGNGQRVEIGEVAKRYRNEDFSLISPTSDFTPAHAVDGAAPRQVAGQFTRLGLADLKARSAEIHKIGAMTGHTTGEIQAIDGITCVYGDPCKRGQLKWGDQAEFTDGDSGSVSYAPDPENPDEQVLVCGLNSARTWWPGEDYIWGTGAYILQEEYGYTF
jgi:hypothetical protein